MLPQGYLPALWWHNSAIKIIKKTKKQLALECHKNQLINKAKERLAHESLI